MAKLSEDDFLLRYTNLAGAINMLQTGAITLLNPRTWDDRNDIYFLKRYHHWRVFAAGTDGVAIRFNKKKLVAAVKSVQGIRAKDVSYVLIDELQE